jgi:predicted O-methyltransferase YrrM
VNRLVLKYYKDLFSYALRNPRQAPALLVQLYFDSENRFHRRRVSEYGEYQGSIMEALSCVTNAGKGALETLPPVKSLNDFKLEIQELAARDVNHIPSSWDADTTLALTAYYVCRIVQPKTVIETGVGHGITSAFILRALADNNAGHLYSVDLPSFEPGSEKFIGNAVPEKIRDRWTLTLGLSGSILPSLFSKLGKTDIFLHDSDHCYHNQKMEYNLAWKHLFTGGVLLSDDVNNSNAFIEFTEKQKIKPIVITQPNKDLLVGMLVKPGTLS